ncbi:MAG: type II secretion system F family protein [Bacteroidetes bacterium]|nr:type II secretion system F family protein [Bacteroidota bacterium]
MGVTLKSKKIDKINNDAIGDRIQRLMEKDLFASYGLSDKEKEDFYQYISTLAGSGIQLPNILQLYTEEDLSKRSKKSAHELYAYVIKGDVLSNAMQKTGVFEPYEYYNVAIGEETGRINEVLVSLKLYYENKIKQARKVRSVLVYPAVVLAISFIAVWFLMTYVVPLFVDVYKRFGGDLPALTKFIIEASNFFGKYSWLMLLTLVAMYFVRRFVKDSFTYKKYTDQLMLNMPIVGALVKQTYMARFCNSMALMLKSNITFLRSLEMTEKMMGFYPLQHIIPTISNDILKGSAVNEAFAKHEIFDKQMLTLIKVGEEVNRLDEMFEKMAHNYEEGLNHNISIINTLIEPVIIIFLGGIIGFILIAMYLPLFNMGNQMVM